MAIELYYGANPTTTTVLASPTPTSSVFTVASAVDFLVGQYILVQIGSDFERVKIDAITGAQITLAAPLSTAPATSAAVKSGRELLGNTKLNNGAIFRADTQAELLAINTTNAPDKLRYELPDGIYKLDLSSSKTADGYFVLTPDTGPGRWILQFASDASFGSIVIEQASHGLDVGDVIRHNGTAWAKAQGNTVAGCTDVWFVFSAPDTNNFRAIKTGRVTVASHGLTVGSLYYLSAATAGLLTLTKPVGTVSQPLGFFLPVVFVESSSVLHILGNSYPTMTPLLAEYDAGSNQTTVTFSNLAGVETDGAYRINADLVGVSSSSNHFVNFKVNNVNCDDVQITDSSSTTISRQRLSSGYGFIKFDSSSGLAIADVLISRVTTRGYLILCKATSTTTTGIISTRDASGYVSESAEINSISVFTNFSNEIGSGSKIRLLRSRW